MKRVCLFLQYNKKATVLLTVFFVIDIIYLSNTSANVPIMDYWRYGKDFLYDIFNGGIVFNDLWESINGQRAFLTYLLYFINVYFFHWNTRIAVFLGSFVTYVTGLFLINILSNVGTVKNSKFNSVMKYVTIIAVSMTLFSYVQWEIKIIEFSAVFSINVFFVILNMWMADKILCNLNDGIESVIRFTLMLSFSICFVFSAFFPAVVGAICICGAHNFIVNYKKDRLKYIRAYLIVGAGILISAMIYLNGINGVADGDNNLLTFGKYISNGDFLKGIAIYLGSSILHISIITKYGYTLTAFVGCVLGFIYILAICIQIKNRNSSKSYFPVMLILYTFLVGILLSYGRGSVFDVTYMSSSRYAFQSKLGVIGTLIVFYNNLDVKIEKFRLKWKYLTNIVVSISLMVVLLFSQKAEFHISPYRRATYETLIQYMYDIRNISDEQLISFQAGDPSYVRQTVDYMKKYHLGVFWAIDNSLSEETKVYDQYKDEWMGQNNQFYIRTGDEGKIDIEIYCPLNDLNNKEISIYINDILTDTVKIEEINQLFVVDAEPNQIVTLTLYTNFAQSDAGENRKDLTTIISSIQGK